VRYVVAFLMSALLFANVGVAASDDDAYLTMKKRDFRKTFSVIALAPVDADAYLEMPDAAKAMLEQEVTARLEKRGYIVIPSTVLEEIREVMERQVGGLTNPDSGEVDLAKFQAVREHAYRELWFTQTFDALATIRVSIEKVPMESDRVEWDGVKQRLETEGRSHKYAASISVSSVSVSIYDKNNSPIYRFYGGLEPLMYRNGEQLLPLEVSKLFLDEKRIRKAAQVAVDPI